MSSVCPSATLVDCDHIGWNTSEIISPLVSLGCSLSADPNIRVLGLLQGEHSEISAQSDPSPVDLSVGDIRSQIAAEWLHTWSQRFRVGRSNGAVSGYIKIQVGGRPPSWIISNGHISATAHSIHLYSAHRAVIFAIAELSCIITRQYTCKS